MRERRGLISSNSRSGIAGVFFDVIQLKRFSLGTAFLGYRFVCLFFFDCKLVIERRDLAQM